jgi:hypothetical protein
VASDETGSGVAAAVKGCHLKTLLPNYQLKEEIKLKVLEMLI